ncbi:MAG: adenine phosphoribosyltransferase [Gemmatimonadota bacterium]
MPDGEDLARLNQDVRRALRDYPDFPRPGILFRDIAPVLASPALLERVTACFAAVAHERRAEKIAGIESRGFLFAAPVAVELGLPLVPIRKQGKLPGETVFAVYDLEYGTARLEMQSDSVGDGEHVMLIDDLLATGGTASAAAGLIRRLGGIVVELGFLVELSSLNGRSLISEYNVFSILSL